MLDIRWIRENPEALVKALVSRQWSEDDARSAVDGVVEKDEARRAHIQKLQAAQERRNAASKEIGNAMRAGNAALAETLKAEVADIKAMIQSGEADERTLDKALEDALAVVPNVPLEDVPVGKDEHDNVEVRRFGAELIAARQKTMPNKPKEHFELGEALGYMDFERAAKLSGARFTVLKSQLARLERALGQFMLDLHTTEHGYTEVIPPLMVRSDAMYGTGQLPKFEDDLFRTSTKVSEQIAAFDSYIEAMVPFLAEERLREVGYSETLDKLDARVHAVREEVAELRRQNAVAASRPFLIPTSEVPLTNLVREEITAHEKLPLRFTALTPCFRSEAGSAGRDTRGMLRQHQFYKVELVSITDQESSVAEHERMTQCAETVLKRLELPFRTVTLCTGDMGFGAQKTYDIEVWLPGQNAFREISSCSVCGDFQARRMDARYRPKDDGAEKAKGGATRFVHTLNGSGVAVGRALIAVMENYQDMDGGIAIPSVLQPYMGGMTKIEARAA
ncbi:MAG: serine--tRNA ligase [Rhizobiaceae bacterium]|nr:serine--tRNA ligase [Rhizobiaceae bacterium]